MDDKGHNIARAKMGKREGGCGQKLVKHKFSFDRAIQARGLAWQQA